MCKKIIFFAVLVFLLTRGAESAEVKCDSADVKRPTDNRISKSERFPVIPDFIKNISYDVKKTDSEIALLSQIKGLFNELSEESDEPIRSLLRESQSSWNEYYEKETYGLHPANGFVTLTISGDKKKINAYRENLKVILEGRAQFINNLLNNNEPRFSDDKGYDEIFKRIEYLQGKVEYFSEERNRPRVAAGEKAWKLFLEADEKFLKSYFADNPEKFEKYKMYALKERLKILELQLAALERLRIEREE